LSQSIHPISLEIKRVCHRSNRQIERPNATFDQTVRHIARLRRGVFRARYTATFATLLVFARVYIRLARYAATSRLTVVS
jgi:hypothetical protein